MNILITFAITLISLMVSVLSFNLYIMFLSKYRILTSVYQVPIVFLAWFVCIVLSILVPLGIITILHNTYRIVAFSIWGVSSLGYVIYRKYILNR